MTATDEWADRDALREGIARVIDDEAWTFEPWNHTWRAVMKGRRDEALAKADSILSLIEAARRSKEGEGETSRYRPLDENEVAGLREGDVLRVILPPCGTGSFATKNEPPLGAEVICAGSIPYQNCVFLRDYEPGFGWHRSRFAFVRRPEAARHPATSDRGEPG